MAGSGRRDGKVQSPKNRDIPPEVAAAALGMAKEQRPQQHMPTFHRHVYVPLGIGVTTANNIPGLPLQVEDADKMTTIVFVTEGGTTEHLMILAPEAKLELMKAMVSELTDEERIEFTKAMTGGIYVVK